MPDTEKVIKHIVGYINAVDGLANVQWVLAELDVLKDALALLKAQEPRVLALDEIHRGMVVWLEDVDKADVILAIGGSSGGGCKCFITVDDRSIAPHDGDYGVRWRAWTHKPTQEQRKGVKWGA